MRQLLFIAFEFLWATVYSQPVTGKIIDADSKTPVEYVNIGVVGKNRGTVCDKDGSFSLLLDEKFDNETLRFSVVGYHPLSFNVADFKKAYRENIGGLIIELAKKTLILKEVFVSPLEFKDKKVGGKGKLGTVIFESNKDTSLGSEVGTVIKVKKAPAFVRDVNIVFTKNTYDDSILFRINIYSMNDKLPGENILKEPIYVSMNTKKGTLT
ncbi:MAG: carboxypeptidase-like regulatory domain-containing protein, partial [Chitinophagaceae bacterium]